MVKLDMATLEKVKSLDLHHPEVRLSMASFLLLELRVIAQFKGGVDRLSVRDIEKAITLFCASIEARLDDASKLYGEMTKEGLDAAMRKWNLDGKTP